MNKTTEALGLAEKTLRDIIRVYKFETGTPVTTLAAIREALAEQGEREPVAWVPLTDDDRKAAFESLPDALEGFMKKWGWLHFAKEIERRCKEKNK